MHNMQYYTVQLYAYYVQSMFSKRTGENVHVRTVDRLPPPSPLTLFDKKTPKTKQPPPPLEKCEFSRNVC